MPDIPDLTAYIMTGTKYLLPILALWILLRCIRSMLREKYEPETWAWLLDEDGAALGTEKAFTAFGVTYVPFGVLTDARNRATWMGNSLQFNEKLIEQTTR